METPALWKNRPVVDAEYTWLWHGFHSLCDSRWVVPMVGSLPIQYAEVMAWLEINGETDTWRRRMFAAVVRHLDKTYLTHFARERELEKAAEGKQEPAHMVSENFGIGLDARGIEDGVDVGVRALQELARQGGRTQEAITGIQGAFVDISKTLKDTIAPAFVRAAAASDQSSAAMVQVARRYRDAGGTLHELAASQEKAAVAAVKHSKSLFSLEGVMARVQKVGEGLGKAFVGFLAVDVLAKVAGFNSAMEVLSKTTDAIAEGIRNVLNPELETLKARAEFVAAAFEKVAKARDAMLAKATANQYVVPGFSTGNLGTSPGGPSISIPDRRFDVRRLDNDEGLILAFTSKLEEAQKRVKALGEEASKKVFPYDINTEQIKQYEAEALAAGDATQAFLEQLIKLHDEEGKSKDRRSYLDIDPNASEFQKILNERLKEREARQDALNRLIDEENQANERGIQLAQERNDLLNESLREAGVKILGTVLKARTDAFYANTQTGKARPRADNLKFDPFEELDTRSKQLIDIGNGVGDAFGSAFEEAILGAKSFGDAIRGLAMDIERTLVHTLLTQPIAQGLASLIAGNMYLPQSGGQSPQFGLPGGFANGAAFDRGNAIPFAGGGIFGSPTYFGMSGGRTGLMGEAGPEAVMPLKRTRDGKLGVAGGGGRPIYMTVVTKDVDSFRHSKHQIMQDLRRAGA